MKILTATLVAVAVVAASSCQGQPGDASNAYCIERLKLPGYPSALYDARLSMTTAVRIVLGSDGAVESRTFGSLTGPDGQDLSPWVVPELDKALNASKFRRDCGGKSVELVFRFEMRSRTPFTGWFEYPNRFQISAEPDQVKR